MRSEIPIERVGRRVIENKLLTALEDKTVVALLVTEEDLREIINSLYASEPFNSQRQQMAKDFEKLLLAAFGP